jgi:hypothetical protein
LPLLTALLPAPDRVLFDHAPKKMQTGATWSNLLCCLAVVLQGWRQAHGLPAEHPVVVVCDNVGSHSKAGLQRPAGDIVCDHLWQSIQWPEMFLFFILPRRSHTLQSGDFHVNLSLRRHTRSQAKMRIVNHFLSIHLGDIPDETPLATGEVVMKMLCVQWAVEWMNLRQLHSWIVSSWHSGCL